MVSPLIASLKMKSVVEKLLNLIDKAVDATDFGCITIFVVFMIIVYSFLATWALS